MTKKDRVSLGKVIKTDLRVLFVILRKKNLFLVITSGLIE